MRRPSPTTLWLLAGSALLAATLAVLALREAEPVYQGKPMRAWIRAAYDKGYLDTNAIHAVRQIGTNGLPWLLTELDCRDGWLKRRLYSALDRFGVRPSRFMRERQRQDQAMKGFEILRRKSTPAVPAVVERLKQADSAWRAASVLIRIIGDEPKDNPNFPPSLADGEADPLPLIRQQVVLAARQAMTNPTPDVRRAGALILTYCPFAAESAVAALIHGLRDSDEGVSLQSAEGLGQITLQPVAAIPPLIEALSDPRFSVRRMAASSLGQYRRQAKTAVPYLLKARSDTSAPVRMAANRSLEMIDPETAAAIPDLPGFKPVLPGSRETSP
jgi:HEAT repeats